jgi:type I restriction enzyme M protein
MAKELESKSMESWIWDAACSIHGAVDAPKYKDFILPLIFVKRLCDVFDDEVNRIAKEVGSRAKAFKLVEHDKKLVRFYIPLAPKNIDESVWSVIGKLADIIGENLTTYLRAIAKENPKLSGIIDRIDFNATTHGVRDIDDDRLSNLIEEISRKRLGLNDVEPDIIGRSYEYLIRKFAEGSGQSAGEFYTPREVGLIMAKIMDPEPGMNIYDPCCGSAGLLIKCELALNEKMKAQKEDKFLPLKLYGQEYIPQTWAMANMNMIIHDMEGQIEIGDTFRNPKFRESNRLMAFDRVVANPMWNQTMFEEKDYDADAFGRFPNDAGYPGSKADWGWMQHILASLNEKGKAAVVFDTGAASRGSGNANSNKEKEIRKWFIENDLLDGVLYLPENLFYNMSAPGIILFINRSKSAEKKNKVFLVNASKECAKGDPKNYITEEGIEKISSAFLKWKEIEKFSRMVSKEEIAKNDYNISPSRYIYISDAEEYRPIGEIWEEIMELENDEASISEKLQIIINRIL